MNKIFLYLVYFYKCYLRIFIYTQSCRFYPSCSEYAVTLLENENFFKAFYKIFLRILRCNQFFNGGIDYPLIKKIEFKGKKINIRDIKYWLVPKEKKYFYLIKNFHYKDL